MSSDVRTFSWAWKFGPSTSISLALERITNEPQKQTNKQNQQNQTSKKTKKRGGRLRSARRTGGWLSHEEHDGDRLLNEKVDVAAAAVAAAADRWRRRRAAAAGGHRSGDGDLLCGGRSRTAGPGVRLTDDRPHGHLHCGVGFLPDRAESSRTGNGVRWRVPRVRFATLGFTLVLIDWGWTHRLRGNQPNVMELIKTKGNQEGEVPSFFIFVHRSSVFEKKTAKLG